MAESLDTVYIYIYIYIVGFNKKDKYKHRETMYIMRT